MKKTIIILLMLINFSAIAQNGWKEANIHDNSADVYPYLKEGAITGLVVSAASYEVLFKTTNLDQNLCRMGSIIIGTGSGLVYNCLKPEQEKISGISRIFAAALTSFAVNVTIGFDSKRDRQRKKLRND